LGKTSGSLRENVREIWAGKFVAQEAIDDCAGSHERLRRERLVIAQEVTNDCGCGRQRSRGDGCELERSEASGDERNRPQRRPSQLVNSEKIKDNR
jgi:hypothetical protein